ncbi:protoporphyrinogen oxidase [bacterium]|nr:protoporphyrinogen oxidase [bacterium]
MSKPSVQKDVVILGAGISGLATAYRLSKSGLDVLVLEKSDHIGGAIRTEECDGFLIDYGPNSTLETSPKIRNFVEEIGLIEDRVGANASAKRRYVLRNGELQPLPMSPPALITSKLFSASAKLRLLKEPFIAPAPQDKEETIAEFVERRLGREFLDYAINPFVAGVYAGDPARLSVRSAVSKIYALEKNYGSLIKGAIKGARERKKRAETDKTKAELFSFKKGMSQMTEALQSALGDRIEPAVQVKKLEEPADAGASYVVDFSDGSEQIQVSTKSLVFTTPAFVTANYLEPLSSALANELRDIVYPPVALVFLGFKTSVACRSLDGFGFLVPQVEDRKILGAIWSSTIFPNRAPEGGIALTTFVGGMRQPELAEQDEEQLSAMVQDELSELLDLQGTPDIVAVKKWHRAIPQYELGHQKRLDAVHEFESQHPGIFISGNFRGGISVGDCIIQSEGVAEKVREHCDVGRRVDASQRVQV